LLGGVGVAAEGADICAILIYAESVLENLLQKAKYLVSERAAGKR